MEKKRNPLIHFKESNSLSVQALFLGFSGEAFHCHMSARLHDVMVQYMSQLGIA